ncbi:MAG: class I SAM-dependent methyltransferase [Anaerolineae bacterium]|jgi:ubiquinone/menaquinone biosynthesis C-methylase UbiE
MPQEVDYDAIAPGYDRRFAAGNNRGVAVALLALAQDIEAGDVLEVGCGTGHWLAGLGAVAPRRYGLDLSAGMLQQARDRGQNLRLVRGRAGRLPFPAGTFDLVYCANALHHFQQRRQFIFEARRLLRPGGVLAVVGTDPRLIRDRWYIYHYFEGTYQTDLARFPSWGTVLDWMAAAGFCHVAWRHVEQVVDDKVGRAVLQDPFLEKTACSQLALLSDEAYAAGLRRIETALAAAGASGQTVTFPVDLALSMAAGRAP